jgi:hypothetical protein
MPITVVCPRCSAKLNAPDTAAGKKVKCPKAGCGEIIAVSAPAPDFEVVDDDPPPRPQAMKPVRAVIESDPQPKKKRRDDDDEEEERPKSKRRRDDEERPRSKRRQDDDDEEERPKSKRRRDGDEEEERPKSKRRRDDDDDDEEERPKSKRRRDDDDDEEDDRKPRPGTCPSCGSKRFTKVSFTWWGGLVGPAILSMVKCNKCRTQFSRKSGKAIGAFHIAMYTLVGVVIGLILVVLMALANLQ